MSLFQDNTKAKDNKLEDTLLIANVEHKPGPSHIEYYVPLLDGSGKLKSAAYLEQQHLGKSNLLSEEQFIKKHGGRDRVYDGFKSPYSDDELKILLENYRREPATRRATDILIEFALGERTELAMDTPNAYANQKRQDEAIKALNEDPLLVDYLDELATIDEKVNANDRFSELLTSGETFGRSVLVIQEDENGIPVRLIPLASIRLGKCYADSATWELLGIEYKDYKGEQRILSVDDIIHYEASDYHITPNTRFMGLSTQEPVMYTAMSLRTAYEIAIPEIRKAKWAPFHILQFPQIQSQAKLDEISAKVQPGKSQVWGEGDIKVHKVELNNINIREFQDTLSESQKEIFRAFGIALVFAFQDEQNRATASFSANLMRVTKLTKIRTRLRNVLEPQWYERNLRKLMEKRQKEKEQAEAGQTAQPTQPLDQYQEVGVINALERSARILKLDPNALPFRPRLKFTDKKVDTFVELAAGALAFKDRGLLDASDTLEVSQLDQYKEKAAARESQQSLSRQLSPALTVPGQSSTNTPPVESKDNPIPNLPLNAPQAGSKLQEIEQLNAQTAIVNAREAKHRYEDAVMQKEKTETNLAIAKEIQRQLRELQDLR